jgi:hypothetical protein
MRSNQIIRSLCFFALLSSTGTVVGDWQTQISEDEFEGTITTFAYVEASKAHSDSMGKKPLFVASCTGLGYLSLRIDWQTYIDDDAFETLAKLDNDQVIELWTAPSAKGTSMYLGKGRNGEVFLSAKAAPENYLGEKNRKANIYQLNDRLKKAKKVMFRQADYRGVKYTAVFNFQGYESISSSALSACN